ncbi:MAG TPA: SDR family oxidoreductase, partial [Balneolaceae bacterium]|nr:SDR family oxidoreductase [Balneolaceae bacterium]
MELKNKVCLVTGANSGIGKATTLGLMQQGAHVIMLCRNEERAKRARREIIDQTGRADIEIVLADLAIQRDIREAVQRITENHDSLDILINNAGIVSSQRRKASDGIERTFAINHLGAFLLTNLLKDALQNAPSARIINVSSEVHRLGAAIFDMDNLQLTTNYSPVKAYGLSKLCNIMFTHELAKRTNETSITANCLHPGAVGTHLAGEAPWWLKLIYFVGKPFMRSPAKGAETPLYLAASEEVKYITGKYFKDKKV